MKLKDLTIQEIKGVWGDEVRDGEIGTPVIKTNNMTYGGRLDLNELTYRSIPSSKVKECYLIDGDLLIEKSGGTKTHSVGYVNIFNGENRKYVANNFILILRPNQSKILPSYLFYQLRYRYESGQIEHLHNQTTGIQNLKVQMYLDQDLKCPSIEKQKNTILVLEKIEQEIELEHILLRKLEELTKSRFIELFGNIIDNDRCWNTSKLNEVCDVRDGTHDSPKYVSEGYPFVTSKNITNGELDFSNVQYISKVDYLHFEERSHVDDGDILMPMIGTVGGAVIVKKDREFSIKNVCLIKFSKTNNVLNTYIKYVLNSDEMNLYFDSLKKGGNQPFIGLNTIRSLMIPIPPKNVQYDFVFFVNQVDKLKF